MTEHRCFMGYTVDIPADEKFYVMVMQELTIYGHTIDMYTQRDYSEDWKMTLEGRRRGMEFGCFHSNACVDGEIGSNSINALREITREEFIEAWDAGWPDLAASGITRPGPVSAVYGLDERGRMVKVWDSLQGDV